MQNFKRKKMQNLRDKRKFLKSVKFKLKFKHKNLVIKLFNSFKHIPLLTLLPQKPSILKKLSPQSSHFTTKIHSIPLKNSQNPLNLPTKPFKTL